MIYDPVSALYSKLTENFNLNMTFRSNIDSDITKSFSIPITIWSKIVGLSVIEPEIPPTLPAKLEFRPDKYFTGLSVAGIYENGNLTEIANYTHLSVTNLPISSEILMVSPKILKVCSCYIDSIYPEVSCIYPVTVEECKYTATITKYPAKTIYSPTDIDIKLNGISGVIQYGTETIPMAATVNLPDDTYFTTYFPSLTEGKNNIPLYATYNFNNSGNNGTFPNWDPFTDGNMAFAETYLPIYVQSDNVILKMKLDCGNEKINVDFSRLIPTDSYRNTDFTIEFDSASDAESAVLSTNQILERKLDGEVEVTVVTDYNIFDDSDTNIPLKCKVNSNWQTGNNDFANYVTEYECHTGILENFAAGCRNMRQNITVKFGVGISIGDNAFRNTSCLTSLTFENENGSEEEPEYLNIGNNAFLSSASFQTFIGAGYSTRDTVNDCVFPIKSNGIVKIGENAFSYTKSLTAVSFANTGNTTAIGNKAFNNANKLQNISLLNSNISELGNETFKNCTSLQSIFFGGSNSKLRKIGSKTFENCNKLEFIILPELLDSIGSSAFMNCDMLTEIHIPAKTSTIGNLAFKNCDRLTAVYIPAKSSEIDATLSCGKTIFLNEEYDSRLTTEGATSNIKIFFDSDNLNTFAGKSTSKIYCNDMESFLGTGFLSNGKMNYSWPDVWTKTIKTAESHPEQLVLPTITFSSTNPGSYFASPYYASPNSHVSFKVVVLLDGNNDSIRDVTVNVNPSSISYTFTPIGVPTGNYKSYEFSFIMPSSPASLYRCTFSASSNAGTVSQSIDVQSVAVPEELPVITIESGRYSEYTGTEIEFSVLTDVNSRISNFAVIPYDSDNTMSSIERQEFLGNKFYFKASEPNNYKVTFIAENKSNKNLKTEKSVDIAILAAGIVGPPEIRIDGKTTNFVTNCNITVSFTFVLINRDNRSGGQISFSISPGTSNPTLLSYTLTGRYKFSTTPIVPGTYVFNIYFTNNYGSTSKDIIINARESAIIYTITWKNDNGAVIDTTIVNYGIVPTHAIPVKPADSEYTYTFIGWYPTIQAATEDATYHATYEAHPIPIPQEGAAGWIDNVLVPQVLTTRTWNTIPLEDAISGDTDITITVGEMPTTAMRNCIIYDNKLSCVPNCPGIHTFSLSVSNSKNVTPAITKFSIIAKDDAVVTYTRPGMWGEAFSNHIMSDYNLSGDIFVNDGQLNSAGGKPVVYAIGDLKVPRTWYIVPNGADMSYIGGKNANGIKNWFINIMNTYPDLKGIAIDIERGSDFTIAENLDLIKTGHVAAEEALNKDIPLIGAPKAWFEGIDSLYTKYNETFDGMYLWFYAAAGSTKPIDEYIYKDYVNAWKNGGFNKQIGVIQDMFRDGITFPDSYNGYRGGSRLDWHSEIDYWNTHHKWNLTYIDRNVTGGEVRYWQDVARYTISEDIPFLIFAPDSAERATNDFNILRGGLIKEYCGSTSAYNKWFRKVEWNFWPITYPDCSFTNNSLTINAKSNSSEIVLDLTDFIFPSNATISMLEPSAVSTEYYTFNNNTLTFRPASASANTYQFAFRAVKESSNETLRHEATDATITISITSAPTVVS